MLHIIYAHTYRNTSFDDQLHEMSSCEYFMLFKRFHAKWVLVLCPVSHDYIRALMLFSLSLHIEIFVKDYI